MIWLVGIVLMTFWIGGGLAAAVKTEDSLHRDFDVTRPKDVLFLLCCGPLVWLILVGMFVETGSRVISTACVKWLKED